MLVGTLTGTAAGFTLLDPGNQIGTIAALTADGIAGNIGIINSIQAQIAGPVSAPNGNVLLEDGAEGGMNLAGTVSAQNGGTISLATNALTESGSPSLQAPGGTVEIAPFTSLTAVYVGGGPQGGLLIDPTALGAVHASELRIGGFHGATDTVNATTIDVAGPVVLGTAAVPTLRLDALDGIGEQAAGILAVGTLDAMAGGGVILTGGSNAIRVLGTIAVTGGDFDLVNTASLAVPSTSTVFASNVLITNTGTVTIDGAIGAGETTPALGSLTIQAIGSPIVVGSDTTKTPLIGAFGTVALLAGGIFTQNGGLINGGAVTIAAGNDGTVATAGMAFTQAGGTIFALASDLAGPSLALSATGDFIQSAAGTIASNNGNALGTLGVAGGGNISLAGEIVAAGSIAITGTGAGSLISSAGTVAAGTDLTLISSLWIVQTGGTLSANLAITPSAGTVACDCGTVVPVLPALPTIGTVFANTHPHHLLIESTGGSFEFNGLLTADWIELHSLNDTTEDAGGLLNATLLSGTAGYTANSGFTSPGAFATADFSASANDVSYLGSNTAPYLATASFRLNDTGMLQPVSPGTISVTGSVQAGSALGLGQTIELLASNLIVDGSGAAITQSGLAFTAAGSLVAAAAIAIPDGPIVVTPGEVLIAADGLRLLGAGTVIAAPDGMVAIAPLTAGNTITVVSTLPGTLTSPGTIAVQDLDLISTLGGSITASPIGVNTLALGSTDGGASLTAGGIAIDAPFAVTPIADTLALFAAQSQVGSGLITQGAGDIITVNALVGGAGVLNDGTTVVGSGISSVLLPELNAIGTIGVLATQGGYASTFNGQGNLLASGGITVADQSDLTVLAGAIVHAGIGSALAGDVRLSAADALIDGNAIAAAAGTVAIGAGGNIEIPGLVSGGTAILNAGVDIDEPGTILAGTLTGSAGGHAQLPGSGAPTANRIGQLGTLGSQTGFLLRDGQALTVTGTVSDPTSLSIAVAPPGESVAGYGVADLTLMNTVASAGTVILQATGNVVEGAGGMVIAGSLIAQAGAIPNTETTIAQANQPGSNPASPLALASVWLGNVNQVGTLAAATATQELLLINGPNLVTGGTVLAGAASGTTMAASIANTPIVLNANPTATLTVTSGDLTVDGTVHAGLDGTRTGDVTLSANDVFINGGVFAADAGTAMVSASGSIGITGMIGGDQVNPAPADLVSLTAGGNIDETGTIGAVLLIGSAGGHALMPGSGAPTANRIATLGEFTSQTGFLLRDSEALTVAGPVSDPDSVSVAVAPAGTLAGGYGIGDLTLAGTVSSPGTVTLQATGNVVEQPPGDEMSGGAVVAGTLIAQAGAIPSTDPGGNIPGTVPGTPVALASIWLGNANQVGALADATATQEFVLADGPSLLIPAGGTVLAGAAPSGLVPAPIAGTPIIPNLNPTAAITVTSGDLTVDGIVHAGLDGSRHREPDAHRQRRVHQRRRIRGQCRDGNRHDDRQHRNSGDDLGRSSRSGWPGWPGEPDRRHEHR